MVKANSDINEIRINGSEVIKYTYFAYSFYYIEKKKMGMATTCTYSLRNITKDKIVQKLACYEIRINGSEVIKYTYFAYSFYYIEKKKMGMATTCTFSLRNITKDKIVQK